jgi:hypothetical protein
VPINLVNVPSITKSRQIGLSWSEGLSNGGSEVIDFRITYRVSDEIFTNIVSGILDNSYTVLGLDPGTTYNFKVQARNVYGLSDYSAEVLILAAQIPDATAAPTTIVLGSNV